MDFTFTHGYKGLLDVCKSGVFIYGYYGVNNLGDDLLAEAVVSGLSKCRFGSTYYLKSHGYMPVARKYPNIVLAELQANLIGHVGYFSKLVGFFKYIIGYHRIFKGCGSFMLGGGTLISDSSSRTTLFIMLTLVALAKVNRMKLYGLGLGLGFIQDRIKRSFARYILNQLEWICVRDESSVRAGKYLAPKAKLNLTADLAFSLLKPVKSLRESFDAKKRIHIGLTLAGPFLNAGHNQTIKLNVLNALCDAMCVCSSKGLSVTLISFQEAILADGTLISDSIIFKELIAKAPDTKFIMTSLTANNEDIQDLYGSLDLVVGMRFHGMVLAALHSTPFVGFSYDAKMRDLCESYSMPYASMEGVSGDWLVNSVGLALDITIDETITERYAERSVKNFRVFENDGKSGDIV